MGIQVEFNPDLALRDISEFKAGKRKIEECVPENPEKGNVYEFLKKGQRLYYISDNPIWNCGEIPMMKTKGNEQLSRPIASVKILESTHFLEGGECWTKGRYKVIDVFDEDKDQIHFEATKRI
jgi:hypothetical protein